MRFAFTDDQLLFRDAVRELLAKECPPDAVRQAWSGPTGWLPDVWTGLAEMGVTGLLVPEQHGGLGLTELDLVLLAEESGRAALPGPVVDTVAVAAPLLAESAPAAVADRWLPAIAGGTALVAVGLGGAWGTPLVVGGAAADRLLLAGDDGLYLVDPASCSLTSEPSVDGTRRLVRVDWDGTSGDAVAVGEAVAAARDRAFDRGALATAAQLVGLADQMLAVTVDYVKERRQFGVPVGSFQAVKHHLADALLRLEFARPAVHHAAWSVAHDVPHRSRDVSLAKALASDAATLVSTTALQAHGAIGYTVEYDLHLWMKRAWALAATWGDAAWHRRRIATAVLGPEP